MSAVADEAQWRRRLDRYRRRIEVLEASIEDQTRELFIANRKLESHAERLEEIVAKRTEELSRALVESEALGRAKTDFLARMSHELRTPLHGVLGMLELLGQSTLDATQQRQLGTAKNAGQQLLSVIGDILDIAKLSSGKFGLEAIPIDIVALVDDIVDSMRAKASHDRNLLRVELPCDRVPPVLGDPVRLRQIVLNLVSNALKFTPAAGEVVVALRATPGPAAVRVLISVKDEGVGIAPDRVEQLFEPFVQAESATTRKFGGTGLGLPIARDLAHAMGGTIDVVSELGQGSTFTVQVPMVRAEALAEAETDEAALPRLPPGLSVLVVDDQDFNRQIARGLLEHFGVEVYEAADGREAIETTTTKQPDIVLMDCHMPEIDGYEATGILIDSGYSGPILGVTADASVDNQRRVRQAGMRDLLPKPYTLERLIRAVHRVLTFDDAIEVTETAPRSAVVFDKDILLTNLGGLDSMADEMMAMFINGLPHKVKAVQDAFEASDPVKLHHSAHALKGSAGIVGAVELQELASELESAGRDGMVPTAAQARLAGVVERLQEALDSEVLDDGSM